MTKFEMKIHKDGLARLHVDCDKDFVPKSCEFCLYSKYGPIDECIHPDVEGTLEIPADPTKKPPQGCPLRKRQ